MLHKLKENLPVIEILLGFCIFTAFIFQNNLTAAVISLIFFIYIWLFTSIILNQYKLKHFISIIAYSGIAVSISLFFILGVEELPYPENAIIFHSEGIVKSLFIFFVSTIPLIIMNRANNTAVSNQVPNQPISKESQSSFDDEKWEEASMDDLESGNFEPI